MSENPINSSELLQKCLSANPKKWPKGDCNRFSLRDCCAESVSDYNSYVTCEALASQYCGTKIPDYIGRNTFVPTPPSKLDSLVNGLAQTANTVVEDKRTSYVFQIVLILLILVVLFG